MTGPATKMMEEVAVKKSESGNGKTLSTKDGDKDKGSSSPRTDNTAIAIHNDGTGTIDNKRRAGRRERSPIVKERAVRGVVRWFNLSKGYGFIHYDKDADDIFVHHSAIVRLTRQPLVLHDNQQVEFDIVQGIKGLEAACVSGPNGQRVGNIHPFALRSGQPPMRRRRSDEDEDHDDEHVLKKDDDDQGGKGEPIKAVSNTDSTGEQKKLAKGNNNGKPNKHRRNNNQRGGGGGTHSSLKDSLDMNTNNKSEKTKEMEASDKQKSANANDDDVEEKEKAKDGQKQKN